MIFAKLREMTVIAAGLGKNGNMFADAPRKLLFYKSFNYL